MWLRASHPQWCPPNFPWQLLACAVGSGPSGWAAASVWLSPYPAASTGLPGASLTSACLLSLQVTDCGTHLFAHASVCMKKQSHCCIFSSKPCMCRVPPSQYMHNYFCLWCVLSSSQDQTSRGQGNRRTKIEVKLQHFGLCVSSAFLKWTFAFSTVKERHCFYYRMSGYLSLATECNCWYLFFIC